MVVQQFCAAEQGSQARINVMGGYAVGNGASMVHRQCSGGQLVAAEARAPNADGAGSLGTVALAGGIQLFYLLLQELHTGVAHTSILTTLLVVSQVRRVLFMPLKGSSVKGAVQYAKGPRLFLMPHGQGC